jgi:O-antigen/teichoic acid export membrane protein
MTAGPLISLPYLVLRSLTAAGALIGGLVQTFVFAHVLSPDRFSIFILVGTLGLSLWLFDLGVAKILFVRLRARHLGASDASEEIAGQASAIVVFYASVIAAGSLLCFCVAEFGWHIPLLESAEFSFFFTFMGLNLVWFTLRNISVAVDQFIFFEKLEALRRVGHIAAMLAMLIGLPLWAFLVAANLLWMLLFCLATAHLARRGALTLQIGGGVRRLVSFFRENRPSLWSSGTYAASEFYIYNFPYLVVPVAIGLGAPTIILDTTFKIFRGMTLIYSAACDLALPRQTRAFAERDLPTLLRATSMAAALCAGPAAVVCMILIFAADRLFALLLGPAATMPAATTPILVVLVFANLVQTVSNFLLVHTGFFKEIARLAAAMVLAMTAATAVAFAARLDIIGFLEVYSAVYVGGALLHVLLVIQGPFRTARQSPEKRRAQSAPVALDRVLLAGEMGEKT